MMFVCIVGCWMDCIPGCSDEQETLDGTTTYTYDHARAAPPERSAGGNRLTSVNTQERGAGFVYNGLGDRYQQA